jgi:hypothetical protein
MSKSKLLYDWQSVSQYVLVSSTLIDWPSVVMWLWFLTLTLTWLDFGLDHPIPVPNEQVIIVFKQDVVCVSK